MEELLPGFLKGALEKGSEESEPDMTKSSLLFTFDILLLEPLRILSNSFPKIISSVYELKLSSPNGFHSDISIDNGLERLGDLGGECTGEVLADLDLFTSCPGASKRLPVPLLPLYALNALPLPPIVI